MAVLLVLPFVFPIALAVGFLGSYIAVVVQLGEVSQGGFLELFWKFQSPGDFLFAGDQGHADVVLRGARRLLLRLPRHAAGRSASAGRPRTRCSSTSSAIHFIGMLTSELFWGGNARLPIGG